ncbi:DNA-3-methyladenine glycosylase I [Paenibacillus thiaminolyticus]
MNPDFDHFDADQIVHYTDEKLQSLLKNKGIVRNKLKIQSVIHKDC